jgi:hypothetical protein
MNGVVSHRVASEFYHAYNRVFQMLYSVGMQLTFSHKGTSVIEKVMEATRKWASAHGIFMFA